MLVRVRSRSESLAPLPRLRPHRECQLDASPPATSSTLHGHALLPDPRPPAPAVARVFAGPAGPKSLSLLILRSNNMCFHRLPHPGLSDSSSCAFSFLPLAFLESLPTPPEPCSAADRLHRPADTQMSGVHKGGFSKGGFINTNMIITYNLLNPLY